MDSIPTGDVAKFGQIPFDEQLFRVMMTHSQTISEEENVYPYEQ